MDDVDYHGPCSSCGRELWLVPEESVPIETYSKVHGFQLPDDLGWFALADANGWSACPVCGWAIVADTISLN